jgi:hypothetical protein
MRDFGKRGAAIVTAITIAFSLACEQARRSGLLAANGDGDVLFADDFESGTLSAWSDVGDPARLRVVTNPEFAQSGSRYLAVTYPAGEDGGWLTRFLMPGHESLYVSYHIRFPRTWVGATKLIALYGSRSDDRWSAFGKAGVCPDGTDFFAAMLVTEASGPTRFYTYYPAMEREPDGVTCWGRYGSRTASYHAPPALSPDTWHRIEFLVTLNGPADMDARQTFWIDGVERGMWTGLSFRHSPILRLNSVQLTFSASGGVPATQELYVDNLIVLANRPAMAAER